MKSEKPIEVVDNNPNRANNHKSEKHEKGNSEKNKKENNNIEKNEEESDDDFLKMPEEKHGKRLLIIPVIATIIAIISFFIKVAPNHRCPPHLNEHEFFRSIQHMYRLSHSLHRKENDELLFGDLMTILGNFENGSYREAFLETAFNHTYSTTLLNIAKSSSSHACNAERRESTSLILYSLQTLREIIDYGVGNGDEKQCCNIIKDYPLFFDIAHNCENNADVLSTVFQTLITTLLLPCNQSMINITDFVKELASFTSDDEYGDVERMIVTFYTIFLDLQQDKIEDNEIIDTICNVTRNSVVHAKTADAQDADKLCYIISKLECKNIPEMAFRMMLRADTCKKYFRKKE